MKMFTLGLMLAGSLTAYNVKASTTVFGGKKVNPNDQIAKSTVNLIMENESSMGSCTGTLLSKKLILTAAHCLTNMKDVYAVFGDIPDVAAITFKELRALGMVHVVGTAVHSGYAESGGKNDDIALLKLKSDAPEGFEPVPMASSRPVVGTEVILAGFGNSYAPFSGKKANDRTLRKISKTLRLVYEKSLVFDNKKSGVSHGDSGGPAYIEDAAGNLTVVGVTNIAVSKFGYCP